MSSSPHESRLSEILSSKEDMVRSDTVSIKRIISGESDDFWFWLLTDGYSADARMTRVLPTMPEERIQRNFTGRSGKDALNEAFAAYRLFKEIAENHSRRISDQQAILDFGCGWGRIIRFFLKDLEPSQIYGADCYAEMIDLCRKQNLNCHFDAIETMPPIKYPDNMFDVIYLYSVFSHLSEEAHLAWLGEFRRILRPGGVLIATTRPVEFIEYCLRLAEKKEVDEWARGSVVAFPDPVKSIREFHEGKFVHAPTGGGGVLDKSFFGETCIPEAYAKSNWTRYFSRVEFLPASEHKRFDQNVIVGVK